MKAVNLSGLPRDEFPDLIWLQAECLFAAGCRPPRRYPLHLRVWRFLAAAKGRSRDPELRQVLKLHQDGPRKAELKARLLTGATYDQIAAKMGLPASIVELYHDLFFAVAKRLQDTCWIRIYAFRNDDNQIVPIDEGLIWRKIAWEYPAALELLIADSRQGTTPAEHAVADRFRLLMRFLHATMNHPDYRGLSRQLRDDTVAGAREAPNAELAQALKCLDNLERYAQEVKLRHDSAPRNLKIAQWPLHVLDILTQRRECCVPPMEAGEGMGNPRGAAVPVADVSGTDWESPPPITGAKLCGSQHP